ncbi:hypothetical protein CANCADRAFT_93471, partial [Tortispora caseinolytica NRRL Y-17796]
MDDSGEPPLASNSGSIDSLDDANANSVVLTPQKNRQPRFADLQFTSPSTSTLRSPSIASFSSPLTSRLRSHYDVQVSSRTVSAPSVHLSATVDLLDNLSSVRWRRLQKLSNVLYSEHSARAFGAPQCLAVGSSILVGTSRGLVLVFSYTQTLASVLGQNSPATESGPVTVLAFSADCTVLAAGHANGNILVYDLSRPDTYSYVIRSVPRDLPTHNTPPDGHLPGSKILHLTFLGKRHSLLASTDDYGIALLHQRVHGLTGARTISTKILGKYPPSEPATSLKPRIRILLAFSHLPYGNLVFPTDNMGIIAVVTPFQLIIIALTPSAQTLYQLKRKSPVTTSIGGVATWHPAAKRGDTATFPMLAYSWANELHVLRVSHPKDISADSVEPGDLQFSNFWSWKTDETIVAINWLSNLLISVVTLTQRLFIIDCTTMDVVDQSDINSRGLVHHPFLIKPLGALTKDVNSDIATPNSANYIPESYFNSIRTFKERIFLLGKYELVVGTLANWADWLLAIMDKGNCSEAIFLALKYYKGEINGGLVGLPSDDRTRKAMMSEKIKEFVIASLTYVLSHATEVNTDTEDESGNSVLHDLSYYCFEALTTLHSEDMLYDQVYDLYVRYNNVGSYFDILKLFVYTGKITSIPPDICKALVNYDVAGTVSDDLQLVLCRLDPLSFDIDWTSSKCAENGLWETLAYIWTRGLMDCITPCFYFFDLISQALSGAIDPKVLEGARTTYEYFAYILSGKLFPSGEVMEPKMAYSMKASLCYMLFLGTTIVWPFVDGKILSVDPAFNDEAFPYLKMLLSFDSKRFFSFLSEAFEDSFLNDSTDEDNSFVKSHSSPDQEFGSALTRQYIIQILLDIFDSSFYASNSEAAIRFSIFLSSNSVKYPQFLILSDNTKDRVIRSLCSLPEEFEYLHTEAELGLECLLSQYRPVDFDDVIELLKDSRYFVALQDLYRSEKCFIELLDMYVKEGGVDSAGLFNALFESITYAEEQEDNVMLSKIKSFIQENIDILVRGNSAECVRMLDRFWPEFYGGINDIHSDGDFALLFEALLASREDRTGQWYTTDTIQRYVEIIALVSSEKLQIFLNSLSLETLKKLEIEQLKEKLYSNADYETIIKLYEYQGDFKSAIEVCANVIGDVDVSPTIIIKMLDEGSSLCVKYSEQAVRKDSIAISECEHLLAVFLRECSYWLVRSSFEFADTKLAKSARSKVQNVFSTVLAVSSTKFADISESEDVSEKTRIGSLSMGAILQQYFDLIADSGTNGSGMTVREILEYILESYTYQKNIAKIIDTILTTRNRGHFSEIKLKQSGWRPVVSKQYFRASLCEICGRRLVGHDAGLKGENILSEWVELRKKRSAGSRKEDKKMNASGHELIVFGCKHAFHVKCLRGMGIERDAHGLHCIVCDE